MIDLREIQLKLENNLIELKNIFSCIDKELNNQENYFLQAKEIEKTIQKLEKNGISVPKELIKLKTDLISKTSYFEELRKLKADTQSKIKEISGTEYIQRKKRMPINRERSRTVIYSFTFLGEDYSVSSWRDFFIKFIEILGSKHSDFVDKAIQIKGKKRPYFTKNKNLLRVPVFIDNIGLYVETNFSSRDIIKIIYALLEIFGYQKHDLKVETNDI